MIKRFLNKIRTYIKPNIGMKRGETREEFIADIERHNRLHQESIRRANEKMQAKWEREWVKQWASEIKDIRVE